MAERGAPRRKGSTRRRPLRPAPGESYTDAVYREVKRRILTLEMPPGMSFTETALVAGMGVGKTPVRSALARLRQEGLVTASARSGHRVAEITVKEARDLFATRILLEAEAARLAAEAAPDAKRLRALERLCQAQVDPGDEAAAAAFLEANAEFHVCVAELSGNTVLAELLRSVLERLQRLFHMGLAASTDRAGLAHGHDELVAAILGGDGAAAQRIAADQARQAQALVLHALLLSDAVQQTPLRAEDG